MEYTLREDYSPQERAAVAARVLAALPEWFGIPDPPPSMWRTAKPCPLWLFATGKRRQAFWPCGRPRPRPGRWT